MPVSIERVAPDTLPTNYFCKEVLGRDSAGIDIHLEPRETATRDVTHACADGRDDDLDQRRHPEPSSSADTAGAREGTGRTGDTEDPGPRTSKKGDELLADFLSGFIFAAETEWSPDTESAGVGATEAAAPASVGADHAAVQVAQQNSPTPAANPTKVQSAIESDADVAARSDGIYVNPDGNVEVQPHDGFCASLFGSFCTDANKSDGDEIFDADTSAVTNERSCEVKMIKVQNDEEEKVQDESDGEASGGEIDERHEDIARISAATVVKKNAEDRGSFNICIHTLACYGCTNYGCTGEGTGSDSLRVVASSGAAMKKGKVSATSKRCVKHGIIFTGRTPLNGVHSGRNLANEGPASDALADTVQNKKSTSGDQNRTTKRSATSPNNSSPRRQSEIIGILRRCTPSKLQQRLSPAKESVIAAETNHSTGRTAAKSTKQSGAHKASKGLKKQKSSSIPSKRSNSMSLI